MNMEPEPADGGATSWRSLLNWVHNLQVSGQNENMGAPVQEVLRILR